MQWVAITAIVGLVAFGAMIFRSRLIFKVSREGILAEVVPKDERRRVGGRPA